MSGFPLIGAVLIKRLCNNHFAGDCKTQTQKAADARPIYTKGVARIFWGGGIHQASLMFTGHLLLHIVFVSLKLQSLPASWGGGGGNGMCRL